MKKSQYLSFLLVFLSVLTVKAQTNTYNMVIEMTNGTKINIGPNEIKNISFNEGQMTFSGESLEAIKNQISNLQMQINLLTSKVAALQGKVDNINGQEGDDGDYETVDLSDVSPVLNFNAKEVLACLKVNVRYEDNGGDNAIDFENTRCYIRSFSLSGFAMKGALNSSSIASGKPVWKDCNFETTFYDGRKDGREGTVDGAQPNETPQCLNPNLIENYAAMNGDKFGPEKSPGINYSHQLLFTFSALSNLGDGFFYIIPRNQKSGVNFKIDYDVEAIDPYLSGTLSDSQTHGACIENIMVKSNLLGENVDFEPGKMYSINVVVGMTTVRWEVDVKDWQ